MEMDIDYLRGWIGRRESVSEVLTPMLVERYNATFDRKGPLGQGDPAPILIHHCLCHSAVATAGLGPDGHPLRGGFLPPVSLPRRMWAGGEIRFTSPARIGETITRSSVIEDVASKNGRSGPLCFVTVRHEVTGDGRAILTERQDIVYRDDPAPDAAPSKPPIPAPAGGSRKGAACDPVVLFRYSALTFNSHRIHFDLPYATAQEGYPGLVVHGPLQAALLVEYATELRGRVPETFSFRSMSPVFSDAGLMLNADATDGGNLRLWTAAMNGPLAMEARAKW